MAQRSVTMAKWHALLAGRSAQKRKLTSRWVCASAMDPKVRLAGSAVGGVANCDRLNSLAPDGVRMLRGVSSLGDGRPYRTAPPASQSDMHKSLPVLQCIT